GKISRNSNSYTHQYNSLPLSSTSTHRKPQTNSTLILQKVGLTGSSSQNSSQVISVPFFEDGVSIVKFFHDGRYFLVGNKNAQMFYLYENFPQSNLKYT